MSELKAQLDKLKTYQHHYAQHAAGGNIHAPVTYGEMAEVLGCLVGLFAAFGIDRRTNAVGQAHAPKRGWEVRG